MTTTELQAQDTRLGSLRIHTAHAASAVQTGVLLYPTIMGLDESMRRCAKAFAAAGMTAVVWDPYDGVDAGSNPFEMLSKSQSLEDRAMLGDVTRIVDHMQDELGLSSIAGIGWCFGGRIALLHAGSDHRIGAMSAYNPTIWTDEPVNIGGHSLSIKDFPGQTLDDFALAASIKGPVQICHPEHDFTVPVGYERLLAALRGRPDPTIYEYYPGAEHGFSYTPGEANERAHRFAWASTLSLFSATFRND